eukprot:4873369-Karenia_brevis.AAC.1
MVVEDVQGLRLEANKTFKSTSLCQSAFQQTSVLLSLSYPLEWTCAGKAAYPAGRTMPTILGEL